MKPYLKNPLLFLIIDLTLPTNKLKYPIIVNLNFFKFSLIYFISEENPKLEKKLGNEAKLM